MPHLTHARLKASEKPPLTASKLVFSAPSCLVIHSLLIRKESEQRTPPAGPAVYSSFQFPGPMTASRRAIAARLVMYAKASALVFSWLVAPARNSISEIGKGCANASKIGLGTASSVDSSLIIRFLPFHHELTGSVSQLGSDKFGL